MPRSPFSGSNTSAVWGTKDGRDIYQCLDTGAVFFDREQIRGSDYQDFYPYLSAFDIHRFDWELQIRRRNYERQLGLMRQFVSGTRLLDMGAGPGYLVRIAMDQGWDAAGVEIAQEAVLHGREQFGVRYVRLEDVEEGSVDALTCHHVLEHLTDPVGFLEVVHRKLRAGGLLVLHVPHQQPLASAFRNAIWRVGSGGRADTSCSLYGDIHISGFTPQSLGIFLERCKFKTHFVRSAGLWSMFYDPFFARSYVQDRAWGAMARKAMRGLLDNLGTPYDLGDWVIGYFAKA